jgi:hypothetical protein
MLNDTNYLHHITGRDDAQRDKFDRTIEMMHPNDVQGIADRLGIKVDTTAPWQTQRDQIASQATGRDFSYAFRHVRGSDY